jgi:hypothetical protein
MSNAVARRLPPSFGERIDDQSPGETYIPVDRNEKRPSQNR